MNPSTSLKLALVAMLGVGATALADHPFDPIVFNDYEAAEVPDAEANLNYGFWFPTFSGSTGFLLTGDPDKYTVVQGAEGNDTKVGKAEWAWSNPADVAGNWMRLTSFNAPGGVPNPLIDLNEAVAFDIWSANPLKVAIGVRETGGTGPAGANGGTGGSIEWVGVTDAAPARPGGNEIPAGEWVTVTINLKGDPARAFATAEGFPPADGIIDGDWGTLEHIAFSPISEELGGLQTVFLDNFRVVSTADQPPLLPGDANRDGRVDGEDFLIWQAAFGTQSGATWDDGDFNGDGRVDGEDFLIWQAHFGQVASSSAVTPEPAALSLLVLAGAALCARRRRS